MVLNMEQPEPLLKKRQESIVMLLEKLSMNVSIKREAPNFPEPKPSPESLVR